MAHIAAREATEAIVAVQHEQAQHSDLHRPLTPAILLSETKSCSPVHAQTQTLSIRTKPTDQNNNIQISSFDKESETRSTISLKSHAQVNHDGNKIMVKTTLDPESAQIFKKILEDNNYDGVSLGMTVVFSGAGHEKIELPCCYTWKNGEIVPSVNFEGL